MSEAIDITSNGRSHGRLTGPIFLRAVDQWHLLEFHSARSKGRSITVEPLTWRGLVTYNVRFFIHLESQPISIAGITDRREACWMRQVAGHATLEGMGHLNGCRYVLHDRDAKFCPEFRETLAAAGVKCLRLPPRSPNRNAFAERWVRSVKRSAYPIGSCSGNLRCGKHSLSSQSIIAKNATIQARTTCCSSLPLLRLSRVGDVASAVENALAAYSGTTAAPHEYFDQMPLAVRAPSSAVIRSPNCEHTASVGCKSPGRWERASAP